MTEKAKEKKKKVRRRFSVYPSNDDANYCSVSDSWSIDANLVDFCSPREAKEVADLLEKLHRQSEERLAQIEESQKLKRAEELKEYVRVRESSGTRSQRGDLRDEKCALAHRQACRGEFRS